MTRLAFPFHYDAPSVAPAGVDEHFIQAKFVMLARERFDVVVVGIPNQGRRGYGTAKRLQQEGMVAGAPDTVINWAPAATVWIEFKDGKGSLDEAQKLFLHNMHRRSFKVAVCRHWLTALQLLDQWGAPRRVLLAA